MDKTVEEFYTKNADQGDYLSSYISSHIPRVKWVVERFGLDKIENSRVVEIGSGPGLYFSQMKANNLFIGLDGARLDPSKKLCPFFNLKVDLNRPDFGDLFANEFCFDWLIASEVIEHVANLDNLMLQMKKLLKPNGPAIFTVPHISMTHPTIFPSIIFPESNFKVFIEQYAWIVEDFAIYEPSWKTCCFKVRNAPMTEQKPMFFKKEEKFWGQPPEVWTSL